MHLEAGSVVVSMRRNPWILSVSAFLIPHSQFAIPHSYLTILNFLSATRQPKKFRFPIGKNVLRGKT